MSKTFLLILAALAAVSPCSAQSTYTENTLRLDDPSLRGRAAISDAAWLAGVWRGAGLGGTIDELWSEPLGNTMTGTFKVTKSDTVSFYEIMALVEEAGGLELWVKHFNPDFSGWEAVDEKVVFPLVRADEDALYFHGLTFKRIDDRTANVYLVFTSGGEPRETRFVYERQ